MLIWTEEEFITFIKTFEPTDIMYKTLFSFLYLTGARIGESLALTWNDINFSNKSVTINKTVTFTTKDEEGFKITSPKTKSSIRIISISDNLIKLLEEYHEYCSQYDGFNENSFLFFVFEPIVPYFPATRLIKHCKLSGVKVIRLHDLRHSHVSLLINKKHNIISIAKRLGHSGMQQTLDTYSHLMPSEQIRLLEDLNDIDI